MTAFLAFWKKILSVTVCDDMDRNEGTAEQVSNKETKMIRAVNDVDFLINTSVIDNSVCFVP